MPLVDGGVVLHSRIGTRPRRIGDLVPQLAGRQRLAWLRRAALHSRLLLLRPPVQMPRTVLDDRVHEAVVDADRVVAVLPGDGVVRLRVPVGVVLLDLQRREPLLRRVAGRARCSWSAPGTARASAIALRRSSVASCGRVSRPRRGQAWHAFRMALRCRLSSFEPSDQGRDLVLLDHLPVDELLDIGMIEIQNHHFGGAARRAARS